MENKKQKNKNIKKSEENVKMYKASTAFNNIGTNEFFKV